MITLYGVTEDGTSVPVQVTDDGKLIVHKDESFEPGDDLVAGDIKSGDIECGDIQGGSIIASGNVQSGAGTFAGIGSVLQNNGKLYFQSSSGDTSTAIQVVNPDDFNSPNVNISHSGDATFAGNLTCDGVVTLPGMYLSFNGGSNAPTNGLIETSNSLPLKLRSGPNDCLTISSDGSSAFVGGNCGFTSAGELYFTSRNQRWKCVVQGGNVMAEEFTRAAELQEKAEQLRQPKTQDIVPED